MQPGLLISIFFLFQFISCSNNKSIPPVIAEKKLEYYYYPKTNMYYDVANKKYLYSLDSAKSWNSFNDETGKTPSTLGTHQVLYSNSDSVWKDNADHRKTYNGRIYHIIKETNDLPTSYNDAREKKPSFKSIAIKKENKKDSTEKSKKGIRGFFNRLFGKHKKK